MDIKYFILGFMIFIITIINIISNFVINKITENEINKRFNIIDNG